MRQKDKLIEAGERLHRLCTALQEARLRSTFSTPLPFRRDGITYFFRTVADRSELEFKDPELRKKYEREKRIVFLTIKLCNETLRYKFDDAQILLEPHPFCENGCHVFSEKPGQRLLF